MNADNALRKDLTPDEFALFRDWIHRHSGIYLEDIKADSLRISLVTRATRFNYTDYADYFRLLSNNEDEFKELMNLVTINETSFFRFPAQFDALKARIIPEIVQGKAAGDRSFRVWSAGCSTGEEPYTIAMTLTDSSLEPLGYSFEVMGSDVSTHALERARKGVYPDRSLTNLSQDTINRWFEAAEGGHRPVARIRERCSFQYHNLIKEPYPLAYMSGWDVIFCRNVTIYFRLESTKRVVDHFYDALNPGGYLFIGHSETLTSVSERFEAVEIDGVFLYRKPVAKPGFTFGDIVSKRQRRAARASTQKPRPKTERKAPTRSVGGRAATSRVESPSTPAEVTADDLVASAHAMLEQARAVDALVLAERALALEPRNLDAHVVAAFSYADVGDLAAAKSQAEEALSASPLAAPARYILGIIKREEGDMDGAIAEFKRTIYIDRDFVLAHFALANIRKQAGDYTQAKRDYENTLRALYSNPEGQWTTFLGGFKTDLLTATCERGLVECGKGRTRD